MNEKNFEGTAVEYLTNEYMRLTKGRGAPNMLTLVLDRDLYTMFDSEIEKDDRVKELQERLAEAGVPSMVFKTCVVRRSNNPGYGFHWELL